VHRSTAVQNTEFLVSIGGEQPRDKISGWDVDRTHKRELTAGQLLLRIVAEKIEAGKSASYINDFRLVLSHLSQNSYHK